MPRPRCPEGMGLFRGFGGTDSLGSSDSGGDDGSLVRQTAVAPVARPPGDDQGYAAIVESRLSAARGAVSGGMRHDRERRRL